MNGRTRRRLTRGRIRRLRLKTFGRRVRIAARRKRPAWRGMQAMGVEKKRYLAAIPILIALIAVCTMLFQRPLTHHVYEAADLGELTLREAAWPATARAGNRIRVELDADLPGAAGAPLSLLLCRDGQVYYRQEQPGPKETAGWRTLFLEIPPAFRGEYDLYLLTPDGSGQVLLGMLTVEG